MQPPNTTVASGDGVGGRADTRVVHDQVGVLPGEVLPGTRRDPPLEGSWLDTYERLAASYPEEVPVARTPRRRLR